MNERDEEYLELRRLDDARLIESVDQSNPQVQALVERLINKSTSLRRLYGE